jgi:hypothetical protein
MSNGLTSVFISVLALATSSLARIDREREFAVWLASRDQGVFGSGVVGFDLRAMPWQPETFTADRDFVLRAISTAKAKRGWDRLGYEPREEWVQDALDGFRRLVEAFRVEDADPLAAQHWPWPDKLDRYELCPRHSVYLHPSGCVVCHD